MIKRPEPAWINATKSTLRIGHEVKISNGRDKRNHGRTGKVTGINGKLVKVQLSNCHRKRTFCLNEILQANKAA